MRVIYLVRAAQLLVTLRALWMLYSVSAFCERTHHTMAACNNMIARIPMATPEEIEEHLRLKQQRAASNRPPVKTITSSPHSTPTAHTAPSAESSTVLSSMLTSSGDVKKRGKRDERRELPGNGITEAQRKAAALTKKEEKVEVKSEEMKKEEDTTPAPIQATTDDKKEQPHEQKKDQKPAPPVEKTETKAEVKKEEKTVETTTAAAEESTKSQKQHAGAKVEIPVAPQMDQKIEKTTSGVKVTGHAPSTSGDETHHTVKKDLKAHVQEPVKVEETKKESPAIPPKLAPAQQRFVLEHSEAFLQEIRCMEVTSDAYFGRDVSPFAEHLKGLVFVGPTLVFVAVYLVCTVMRTRLSNEHPTEFTEYLGGIFHSAMWLIVGISMYFIANHWTDNWHTVSSNTFTPAFPCQWSNLIILASFMMVACSIEMFFHRRLHYDIVFERSYRCYEVIDNSEAVGQNHDASFRRTNVY